MATSNNPVAAGSPRLSVLMPNYNHGEFIAEALEAILAQSYRPHEVIVLDDASTDNSVEIISDVARRNPVVKLVRHAQNRGVVATVNELLTLATGDYLYSPASDDRVMPGLFEKSMALLTRYPTAGLCSTVGCLIGKDGRDRGIRTLPVVSGTPCFLTPEDVRRVLTLYGRWIDASSVIYRRDAFLEEPQIEALGSFADSFANLVVALRHGACFVPEPLSCFRQVPGGYASRNAYDWEALVGIGAAASRLMRTKHAAVFPAEFVPMFERHWAYGVMISTGRKVRREQDAAVDSLVTGLPSAAGVRWVARALTRGVIAMTALAWRLMALLRFGAWGWWVRGRLSLVRHLRQLRLADRFDY